MGEQRPKLAVYWSSSCGGCEIAFANLHEQLLEVTDRYEFFFCPCLLDTKKSDVEALPDGGIALTLFNGAIRTEDNAEMAHLLRRKSRLLVAYGSCAASGGIPALSNLHGREAHFDTIYRDAPALDNPEGVVPRELVELEQTVLTLPRFLAEVHALEDVVPVDYSIPGCPPEHDTLWAALAALAGEELPARGTVLGGTASTVCDQCGRTREEKKISRFYRTWQIVPDPTRCLLDQGLVCMGVATRGGCGAPCPEVNAPCIGCYGAPEGVYDQAAKMASTLGGMLDIDPVRGLRDGDQIATHIDEALAEVTDLVGTASKFTLGSAPAGRLAAARGDRR